MGIFDAVEKKAEDYIWTVGAKKVAAAFAGWLVGKVLSAPVLIFLASHGVTVDPVVLAAGVEGSVIVGSVALHDYLKLKYGEKPFLKFIL